MLNDMYADAEYAWICVKHYVFKEVRVLIMATSA